MSTSTSRSKESLEKVPQRRYFQVRRQLDDAADAAQRRFDCQFVILDGLQSEEELQRLEANKINGYKSTEFPYNNQESSAKLDFTSNWQAIKAKVKLRKIIADLNINYVTAQQMNHHYSTKSISYLRKARIIVRNLPSNIKISQIKDHFSKFGAILEISIPNEGKSKGQFAFIQYTSKKESEIAVREMNLSEIYGRQIVVDIAVSKKDYDLHVQKMSKENSEDENDDNNQQSTIDNTQNIEHNNESKDIEVESADEESEDPEKKELNRPNDGAETPTLFVTKIAEHFDDSYLKTVFSEFGPVRYFNRMASRSTGQPTRRGFVQFVDSESLEKCLAEARSNKDTDDSNLPNIELKDGSRVNIFRAVSREKASELKQLNEFRQSKRNLNLATISKVQIDKSMSKEDRILRERVEKKNSELLRNPNTMISPLRICIVNLPNHVTAQVLKKYLLSKKLVKSRETQECKVIYQGGKMNDRSKHTGIAYITVNRHITAKKLVEFFNNNSHFSSRGKLIAYFSIENSLILAKKRQQTNGSFNRSQNEAMKPRPASKTTKGGKKNPIAKKAKLS